MKGTRSLITIHLLIERHCSNFMIQVSTNEIYIFSAKSVDLLFFLAVKHLNRSSDKIQIVPVWLTIS